MERSTVLIAVFAALIAALGLVPKFTLAFGVPITAQSLGIMLCGTVLGAKRGGAAALLFVVLTLAGLPLLAGGRGGLGLLSGPSVGFIIGFPIAAFVTGWVMERVKTNVLTSSFIASFMGGVIALYVPGVIGLALVLDKSLVAAFGLVSAFLIGDLVKVVICGFVTQAIYRARKNLVRLRAIDRLGYETADDYLDQIANDKGRHKAKCRHQRFIQNKRHADDAWDIKCDHTPHE